MNVERAIAAAAGLVAAGGAAGIGGALLLNCMGLPFASELILPFAGVAVARGELAWMPVIAYSFVGQVVGFVIAYWLARVAGVGMVERFGRYVLLSHDRIVAVQHRFQRHGSTLVFIGACLPWAHGGVGFSAGLARLPFGAFLALMSAGTLVYTVALVAAGFLFGDALPRLVASSGGLVMALVAISGVAAAAFWYSKHRFGVHPPAPQTDQPEPNRR